MNYTKVVINGRFLEQKITGVQRYALEITKQLDEIATNSSIPFLIAIPESVPQENIPLLKNIQVVTLKGHTGILWEQLTLARYLHKRTVLGVHLCNSVPLLSPNGIVCIHDITYKINPQFITTRHLKIARAWHCIQYSVAARKAIALLTVSEFCKKQIQSTYHVPASKITVVYNGWQHFNTKIEDESRMNAYPFLTPHEYYFSLATLAKNKNFAWIVKAAVNNPEAQFAVAGSSNLEQLGNSLTDSKLDNIHYLGYVSDADAKLLMKNCKAFLFPSLYEGFGVPPLEALAMGAHVICSNASCLPEIFKNGVVYINPTDYSINLKTISFDSVSDPQSILSLYSWQKSAKQIYSLIMSLQGKE